MSSPRLSRRQLLAGALSLPLAARQLRAQDAAAPNAAGSGPRRPNLLYVFSDSHRASSMGIYGNDDVISPALDAFASQGALVRTCLSNTPTCRPYRASLFTGAHAHTTGMVSNQSPYNFAVDEVGQWRAPQLATLGETFRDAGYRCGYIGKWHLGRLSVPPGPLRFGFDDLWYVARKPPHEYAEWTYVRGPDDMVSGSGGFRTDHEVDEALRFCAESQRLDPERPWLLSMSWGPPHGPMIAPPGYERESVRLPPNVGSPDAKAAARRELPGYYALIHAMDDSFARLMRGLDELGLAENTIVVYTSDHGNQLGSQNLLGKEMAFDESLRVPFALRWPRAVPAGLEVDSLLGTPDILPTLCGLAGLEAPASAQGLDLSAAFRGEADAPRREQAYLLGIDSTLMTFPGWRGLHTDKHLLVRNERRVLSLYDMSKDPFQMTNLVERRPKIVAALDDRLNQEMTALGDRWRPA